MIPFLLFQLSSGAAAPIIDGVVVTAETCARPSLSSEAAAAPSLSGESCAVPSVSSEASS
jgi:hypothetical protein